MIEKDWLAKLFSLILLNVFFAVNVAQADPSLFMVEDVPIYAESMNLFDAKIEALDVATEDSFGVLLNRLLPRHLHWRVKNLSDKAFSSVDEVKIKDERMTAFTYSAKADISFRDKNVKKILNREGIFFVSKYSLPQLLIPVLFKDLRYSIWDDNDWEEIWGNIPNTFGLLQFKFMLGDLNDQANLDPLALTGDKLNFDYFASTLAKYGASEAVIVIGRHGKDKFEVTLKHLSQNASNVTTTVYDYSPSSQNYREFYQKVATESLWVLDSYYKNHNKF